MSCCVKCHKSELEERRSDIPTTVKDEPVLVQQFPALVCPKCGYTTVHGNNMPEFLRSAADVYRRKHSLLTSDEIRLRRERLDQSQKEFADHLDVGIASVKRWEMGQVQDKAMDRLIRLSTDIVEAQHNVRKLERLLGKGNTGKYWIPDELQWERNDEQPWQRQRPSHRLQKRNITSSC